MILVFGALAVPRIGALSIMALRQHIVGSGDGHAWSAAEMKAGQPYDARLGPELSTLLDTYISSFRPILLARGPHGHASREPGLWLSKFGDKLSALESRRSRPHRCGVRRAGVSPCPAPWRSHDVGRRARPDLIDIVKPLLQHGDERSREHYNLAGGIAASTRFGDALRERRAATPAGRRLMCRVSRARQTQFTEN